MTSKLQKNASGKISFSEAIANLNRGRPIRNARLRSISARLAKSPSGDDEELDHFLAVTPDNPDALFLKSQLKYKKKRYRDAIIFLSRCLAIDPSFTLARYSYAATLFQVNRYPEALNELEQLLLSDPNNPVFRNLKANILETIGEPDRSLLLFRRLTDENPNRAEFWISYGQSLRAVGQHEDAITAFRQAILDHPSLGQAYWSLAHMKTARFADADITAMQIQLARNDIAQDDRILLQFSLGKAYEDRREYARSFEYYAKGNAAMRFRIDYNPAILQSGITANKSLFTREFFSLHEGFGCHAHDPIFILGRPRSGSTLIEQILSSHSMIEGTSELPYIISIASQLAGRDGDAALDSSYLNILAKLSKVDLASLGDRYLTSAQIHRKTDKPFFIDKKPANFLHIGLIHLILPNAKIIDARRNPAACSFSMFATYSAKSRLRLTELGSFYRAYLELMEHFETVLSGRIHRVIYENLVSDTEAEVRRLMDYLGVPFEADCLRFYETKRTVLTPSSEQVRRPISRDAVAHWKNYETWLGPLIRSLGLALELYPKVPDELRQ